MCSQISPRRVCQGSKIGRKEQHELKKAAAKRASGPNLVRVVSKLTMHEM